MNLPHITAICCTYGRNAYLNEAVACFLAQDYEGPHSLVILNTMWEQTLVFKHPLVDVLNCSDRPKTMGETRNMAIDFAPQGLLCVWDDDDLYQPNHLSNFVRGFDPEKHEWSQQSHQGYMEAWSLKSITSGSPNVVAFTKKAWAAVGGYPEINCGEDARLLSAITSRFAGVKVNLASHEVSFLYHFGQGVYHLSGQGMDKTGEPDGMTRTARDAQERIKSGRLKTGTIQIVPKIERDYVRMLAEFTGSVKRLEDARIGKISICLLGRHGDIFNFLPIAKFIADKWGKPLWFISKEFAGALDGVSYVIPMPLDMPHDEILGACKISEKYSEQNICGQVWGKNFNTTRESPVYNTESWRIAGFLEHFNDTENFPLVIDQRGYHREQKLSDSLGESHLPRILVNITSGHTAPFAGGKRLLADLKKTWSSEFHICDIAEIRAHRIYDMLGLFDTACLLITTDTALLHLAAASDIQVVALLNDIPWLSSVTRCNTVLRLKYAEALPGIGQINEVIGKLKELCAA